MSSPSVPPERVEALERLAREATPGPWRHVTPETNENCFNTPGVVACAHGAQVMNERVLLEMNTHFDDCAATAEFIAACSPEVILSLLSTLRAAQQDSESADVLHEERRRLRETVFFFASVIRSGEPFTSACEAALKSCTMGWHEIAAELAASTREGASHE